MSEVFIGKKGKFVELEESIDGFGALLEGQGANIRRQPSLW